MHITDETPDEKNIELDQDEDIDMETLERQNLGLKEPAQDAAPPQPKHFEIPISKPVKITSKEELTEAIAGHAAWLESVVNPKKTIIGGRANFKDADLRGYDLSGVNLSGATFIGANLEGVDLTGSNFTAADFTHANLQGAKLANARLKKAVLNHANLIGTDYATADLTNAHMHGTILVSPEPEAPVASEEIPTPSEEPTSQP